MVNVRSIVLKEATYGTSIATATAPVICLFNIAGYKEFTVTVRSSATALVSYSIQTAPKNEEELFTNITSTSVAAGSSIAVTKNTFSGNHQAWLRVSVSSTATIPASALRVIFSATEE